MCTNLFMPQAEQGFATVYSLLQPAQNHIIFSLNTTNKFAVLYGIMESCGSPSFRTLTEHYCCYLGTSL